jgi:nitronate monooxygenase
MQVPAIIRTWLTEQLGLRYPIIQAPMAGGPTTPRLVAAVGNAGALGSFGFAYTDSAGMERQVEQARSLTRAPLLINLFVENPPPRPDAEAVQAVVQALEPLYRAVGAEPPQRIEPPYAPDFDAQLRTALALRPAVLSTHFHRLQPDAIAEAHACGILVAASATTLAEAQRIEALGADFIIAQGTEAGGHRATFMGDPEDALIGTLALTRTLVRHCKTPIVAAGGIMDGAGLAAVLALGACGVQMGTAFVATDESGAPEAHKQGLFAFPDAGTAVTRAFSGRPARSIRNAFVRHAERERPPILPFPVQALATAPLRAASAKQNNPDYVSLWAGQAYTLARRTSAGELIRAIAHEYEEATQGLLRAMRG